MNRSSGNPVHTVLVVDDEYLIAEILGMALEDAGFVVVIANSALKGMEMLERDRPDLVITDYMMPGMNGAEFARKIRSRPAFHLVPIVLMTGGQSQIGRSAPELFDEVFDKPFEINSMIASIQALIARAGR